MKRHSRHDLDQSGVWKTRIPGEGGVGLALALGLALGLSIAWTTTLAPPVRAQNWLAQHMVSLRQTRDRWIEINVSTQRLIAWEGNTPVYAVIVSTGVESHPTLIGSFKIQSKHRTARMRGEDYDVPDVPFVMYYDGNYGIHGAYWHHSFGTPVSHGCVNVAVDHAEWLFNWAAIGTPVVVHY
jgi:lipoprotein-anchoring transpeptidase ErfK/SrfK